MRLLCCLKDCACGIASERVLKGKRNYAYVSVKYNVNEKSRPFWALRARQPELHYRTWHAKPRKRPSSAAAAGRVLYPKTLALGGVRARLRKRHEKTRADLVGAFRPYRATMYLGHTLDDGQPQPIAGEIS